MPEGRSRSRKRKAAPASSAAKTGSRDADKDAQPQASVREERYVPRFGSATKRARTASMSSSQPPPAAEGAADNRFTPHESEEQVVEESNKTEDTALFREVRLAVIHVLLLTVCSHDIVVYTLHEG